ncbi:MAG: sulfatase-like hydrolase/transferase [Cyclobacteriaceae bacterium]
MFRILSLCGVAAFYMFVCGCSSQKEVKSKPNILFIFTDDQTYTAINALGNDEIITPNMDRLVYEGTTFDNAFNMGAWNGAVCTASRSMLISGRSVWRANDFRKKWQDKDPEAIRMTWPKLMESAGYDTYMTGKWHVDVPATSIFQNVSNVRPGMPDDAWDHAKMVDIFKTKVAAGEVEASAVMPIGYNRPLGPDDDSWSPTDTTFGGFWKGGQHWSEVLKDDAIAFLDRSKKSENPFFMYLAFNAPHDPRQAPQSFQDMYDTANITIPESWMPEYPNQDLIGNGPKLRDEALAPFPRTEFATKTHIKEYYAIITHLDEQIGKILDKLEATGQRENTYIFFTADHGLAMGRHGLIGKQSLYDHSVKPPFIVVGPGVPANQRVDAEVYLQDVMATSLDLAGVGKPDYVEFNNVLPIAKGERQTSYYNGIYGAYIDYQRSIRKDGFKLMVFPKADKVLLFDLLNDPEEMYDLSEQENYLKTKNELLAELDQMQDHFNDPLN